MIRSDQICLESDTGYSWTERDKTIYDEGQITGSVPPLALVQQWRCELQQVSEKFSLLSYKSYFWWENSFNDGSLQVYRRYGGADFHSWWKSKMLCKFLLSKPVRLTRI